MERKKATCFLDIPDKNRHPVKNCQIAKLARLWARNMI